MPHLSVFGTTRSVTGVSWGANGDLWSVLEAKMSVSHDASAFSENRNILYVSQSQYCSDKLTSNQKAEAKLDA